MPANTLIDAFFRSGQIGNRIYQGNVDTYRLVAGLEGTVFSKYDWQINYNNGVSSGDGIVNNLVNEQVSGGLTGATYTAGNLDNLSAAALAGLRVNADEKLRTQEDVWSAQVSGPAFQVPAGDVSVALGGDYRSESLSDTPDFSEVSGIVDQGGTPTSGKYSLKEAFAELKIPVLKDMFLVKELTIDGAARYSSYSTFGDAETWKATINYAPTEDLRFRGTISTAFRAPTLQELDLANTQTFQGVSDACDTNKASGSLRTTASGTALANVIANCAKTLGAVGINPATYSAYANSQQILGISGGNAKLTPETSRNLSVGTVITPGFLPDLQLTVDYWHIRIANQVIQLPDAQTAVNSCYSSANLGGPTCASVGPRTPVATPSQVTPGGITKLILTSLNEGKVDTDGIDFGLDYKYGLDKVGLPEFGTFLLHHTSTLTMLYDASDQTGAVNHYLGTILPTTQQGGGYPEYQSRTSFTVGTKDLSVTWTTRFIQGMARYTSASSPPPVPGVYGDFTPDVWYHDVSASYTLDNLNFVAGMQNVFDRTPPYFADGIGRTNSNPYIYDYLGRFLYLKVSIKFGGAEAPRPMEKAAYIAPPPAPVSPPAPVPAKPDVQRAFQVFFDFDKSDIKPEAAEVIAAAAQSIKSGNMAKIRVTGHTDTVGSNAYNQKLSERRANAVKDKLIADGVPASEIDAAGVGKSGLLVSTGDGVREPQNRRAQIVDAVSPSS